MTANDRSKEQDGGLYGGYAKTPLNPEPYAYESAVTVRWLIQDQIKGDPKLNFDPEKGAVKSPLLLWGPYLWADGEKGEVPMISFGSPRPGPDGTHPSDSGRQKVAEATDTVREERLHGENLVHDDRRLSVRS